LRDDGGLPKLVPNLKTSDHSKTFVCMIYNAVVITSKAVKFRVVKLRFISKAKIQIVQKVIGDFLISKHCCSQSATYCEILLYRPVIIIGEPVLLVSKEPFSFKAYLLITVSKSVS